MTETTGYERSARLYDLFEKVEDEAPFRELARGSDVVLDVGAGTGELSLLIAEEGAVVVAVEPSESMQDIFEEKLEERDHLRDRITILQGTAQSFSWQGSAGMALMRGAFDHVLSIDGRREALENVMAHLDPGARFVFNATVWVFEGHDLRLDRAVESDDRRYERHLAREVDGDRVTERWVYRIFEDDDLVEEIEQPSEILRADPEDVREQATGAGLVIDNEWSTFGGRPFETGESYWLVLDTTVQ